MTISREDQRKRSFRDLQPATEQPGTDLRSLCIVVGCTRPRVKANLCRACDAESSR